MIPEGYTEYKRREYCKAIKCPNQLELNTLKEGTPAYELVRKKCSAACLHTTHEFHRWLTENGYVVIKPKQ
ncbi:hypothetical protein GX563_11640 [Candidatus Bathyarchaeota archaeon]|nr:hypothetical protein [Candidatus Bathyarchaeota archaeon]